MFGDDFVVRRIRHRFTDAENQPGGQQQRKAVDQAGGQGGRGPHQNAQGQKPIHLEAIHQPAGNDLKRRIRPEKRRQQHAKLRWRKMQVIFQNRRGDRKSSAVDVVDQDRDGKQYGDAEKI